MYCDVPKKDVLKVKWDIIYDSPVKSLHFFLGCKNLK